MSETTERSAPIDQPAHDASSDETPPEQDGGEAKPSAGRRMGMAAVLLSVSILLSRLLGFVREAVISALHGASLVTDAYYAAFTLPDLMSYFLAGGTLSITFIPLFSSYLTDGDEEGGWRLFSIVASTMGLLLSVAIVAAMFAAPWVVPKLNPGFKDPEQLRLAVLMTRIVLPAQLAFYLGGLVQATLLTREVFWPAALSPLLYNICIILGGVLLGPWLGVAGFSVGVLVGALIGPLALPLWAARRHVRFRFTLAPTDPGFRTFLLLTLPLMIGVSLVTVDEWLLRYFGSEEAKGAITRINHARKMMMVLFAVIGQAAGQAALPFLTRLFHEGDEEAMGSLMAESLRRVVFFALIGAVGLMSVNVPLIRVVFERGAFTRADSMQTAGLLFIFAMGLVPWATQSFAVRGFYARKNTLTPMILGSCVATVAVPIYWTLHTTYQLQGIAIASVLGISLNATATVVVYRWRAGQLPLRPVLTSAARALLIAGAGALGAWLTGQALTSATPAVVAGDTFLMRLLHLIALCVGFGLLALIPIFLMRPPELEIILGKLRRKLGRLLPGARS